MTISAPIILVPTNGADYSTNIDAQSLSGTTTSNTANILVNGSSVGVSYTPGDLVWAWNGTLSLGVNTIAVTAVEKTTNIISAAASITITYVQASQFIYALAPSGVSLRRYQDKVQVINAANTDNNIIGYNYYVSYQSGGVNNQYVKINPALVSVTNPSFQETVATNIGQTVDQVGQVRITTITDQIVTTQYYSVFFDLPTYNSMVSAGSLPDVGFNQDTPLYYVITAVIYDPVMGAVSESPYSPELEGSPITISTGIMTLPPRTQNDIMLTYSREILLNNAGTDLKPGTVLRDELEPISEEQARIYVIQDFLARSQSVSALQDFDDANGDGVSDPVDQSVPKKTLQLAMLLTSADQVQNIIDAQFDNLGSNVNVIRGPATAASGVVVLYTTTPPIRDMTVSEGGQVISQGNVDQNIPSQAYTILETKTLTYANRDSFYNKTTKQYELSVHVEAVNAGSAGNTGSYTVTTPTSGVDSGFLATNPNPIEFGTDIESNHDMASRIQLAFFADCGTKGGYAKTAVSIPGVHGVRVEKAGDPLMFRDYDVLRKEHIGGKVDVYVNGEEVKQVQDTIAFSFASGNGSLTGEKFDVISAVSFQFKSENPLVTAHTPIFEVLQVRNATRGASYDLTGLQIIGSGDTIDLNEALVVNATIGLASSDTILVDYRYRSSDTYILQNQPVLDIVSVTGQLSGPLTSDNWELVKLQDPLEDGGSTIATDSIRIKFANGLPVTEFQTITDEAHVLISGVNENLNYIGIDPSTISITNQEKSVSYVRDADFSLTIGTETTPTIIKLIDTGLIDNGQTVLVSYVAEENFTIVYTTNGLLGTVQNKIDQMSHACADVIVKGDIQNSVDFQVTVIPVAGLTSTLALTSQIQTAVANFIGSAGVGVSINQSDIIDVIKSIPDVDYVIVPFAKMAKSDGSLIVRDDIGSPIFQIFNTGLSTSYITQAPVLTYKTIDQGGPANLFRGVFENKQALVLQTDPLQVSGGPGRAYIQADGRIIVSSMDGNLPDTKSYLVAYYVYGEIGAKDIEVASLESLQVGNFVINYGDPRAISKQSF